MHNMKKIIICSIISFILLTGIVFCMFYKSLKLNIIGSEQIQLVLGQKYKEKNAQACYGNIFKCKKLEYQISGQVLENKIGTYKLKYKVTYNKKTKIKYRTIDVIDNEAPVLTIEKQHYYVCPNGKIGNLKYKAIDNYDKDITNKVKKEIVGNRIVLSVKDSSGNETKKSVIYKKEDIIAPNLVLKGDTEVFLKKGENYIEPGFEVSDNCDDVKDTVEVTAKLDTNNSGNYSITYSAIDNSGNKTSVVRKIKVYEKNETITPPAKTIYLTFDDGPGKDTERLLNVLKQYNIKATFFVTNQYSDYESMITRAFNEGHAIGLHTYTHNYAFVYSSVDNYFNDLNNIKEKVKRLTNGYESKLVRFPGGSSNTISRKYAPGIMTNLANQLIEQGYQYFDWNIVSGDAGETKDTNQIINNVIANLKDDFSVVLQHDVKSYSVDAVEAIIKYGLENGYTFLPLDVTSPPTHQHINN